MAITRERKEELLGIYGQSLTGTDGFILVEFKGLNVARINDLRQRLAGSGATYMVTKNTLFGLALEQGGWPVPSDMLLQPSGAIFGNGSTPAAAKVVQKFAQENPEQFIVKGGVFGTTIFKAADLEAVSNLPTMEEIRAQIVGLIVTPASQLAGVLSAATSQIVNVLQAYEDQSKEGAAA